ncbi:hypothetical protein H9W90_10505 [Polaribacter pectinis]|uniref:Uncharacterized protein n=1 Tax=Polaribacter pectinis TaxID=2738844 RepID=A0A7G9L7M4_9FLAO|nr:hypothetical protein [Polaribacter pectinis]QNM84623.1 hypothetical protein H9W90_10485 [Polaribacter pectinis]QNM84627.1 hypothetical protein H9W90_10505 [Polaribacter pectinis]
MTKLKSYIILILILISVSCSQKKSNKTDLENYIESIKEKNSLTENPLILIDGYIREYELMNTEQILLLEDDILSVKYFEKEKSLKIFGESGKNGAIFISTLNQIIAVDDINPEKRIIYILNGNIISKKDFEEINENKIVEIETLKEKKIIERFSTENYEELIYVITKQETEKIKPVANTV